MAERKDRMALLSKYDKFHALKYGDKPTYNKWAEQWAADALIDSYGMQECFDLLEYYFDSARNPSWKYFSNFTDEIRAARERIRKDQQERKERRQKAREWLSD